MMESLEKVKDFIQKQIYQRMARKDEDLKRKEAMRKRKKSRAEAM